MFPNREIPTVGPASPRVTPEAAEPTLPDTRLPDPHPRGTSRRLRAQSSLEGGSRGRWPFAEAPGAQCEEHSERSPVPSMKMTVSHDVE